MVMMMMMMMMVMMMMRGRIALLGRSEEQQDWTLD